MTVSEGMDPARVREIAGALRATSEELHQIGQSGTTSLQVLADAWEGQDLEAYAAGWDGARRTLASAADLLSALGERLGSQADDQDGASEASAPAGSGTREPGLAGDRPHTGPGDRSGNPDIPGGEDHEDIEYEEIEGPVYSDGVQMTDVSQGGLGDCWLVASMMSLARTNPELLEKAIKDNGDGTYDVTLYEDGKPVTVTVSGEFPARDGNPAYADNDGNARELWPMLIEKAAAQQLGGDYDDIVGDKPGRAMELLTGKEPTVYEDGFGFWDDLDQPPADQLKERFDNGDSMVFSTRGDDKSIGDHELVGGHAYVITDVADNGDVTLQNPWGASNPPITVPYDDFEKYCRRLTIVDA